MKLSIETKHVQQDLMALKDFDINAFGRVAALLRELHANQGTAIGQNLIDQLNLQDRTQKVGEQMIGNSLKIQQEMLRRDLWRFKLWRVDAKGRQRLEPYRIIYGFFATSQFRKTPEIRILAVPCRTYEKEDSYDYQPDHPITLRVRADYDAYQ
ncbi:MAG: hypothetical protein PHU06_00730 [Gallionella sp.]|nr:hypothetical protein [Gallionella sp.]MDD4957731.1 hypothetical protein [Gallionella sp.]